MRSLYLDVVYVVDATNGGAITENAREHITRFGEELVEYCKAHVCGEQSLREKFVFFGDFATEGEDAIIETEFYESTRRAEFLANLDREDIKMSGGDLPENGFEALYTAMKSDWRPVYRKRDIGVRHIIVLITDAYPLELRERDGAFGYEANAYPADQLRLREIWEEAGSPISGISMSKEHKRLVVYAPDGCDNSRHSWENVRDWEKTISMGLAAGGCGGDIGECTEANGVIFEEIFRDPRVMFGDISKPLPEPIEFSPKMTKRVTKGQVPEREFVVDIAFVLDTSGKMGLFIDYLKRLMPEFGFWVADAFSKEGKRVNKTRVRFVYFADYEKEGDEALWQTDFYDISDNAAIKQAPEQKYVRENENAPENALEALYAAILTDWAKLKDGRGGRQIIILMTDKYPLHLMERKGEKGYPSDVLPETVDELGLVWEGKAEDTLLSDADKRLILFAPSGEDEQGHSWKPVTDWENTTYFEVAHGDSLRDINIVEALKQYIAK